MKKIKSLILKWFVSCFLVSLSLFGGGCLSSSNIDVIHPSNQKVDDLQGKVDSLEETVRKLLDANDQSNKRHASHEKRFDDLMLDIALNQANISSNQKDYRLLKQVLELLKEHYGNTLKYAGSERERINKELYLLTLMLNGHEIGLADHARSLDRHEKDLDEQKGRLGTYEICLAGHARSLGRHKRELDVYEGRLGAHDQGLYQHHYWLYQHTRCLEDHSQRLAGHEMHLGVHDQGLYHLYEIIKYQYNVFQEQSLKLIQMQQELHDFQKTNIESIDAASKKLIEEIQLILDNEVKSLNKQIQELDSQHKKEKQSILDRIKELEIQINELKNVGKSTEKLEKEISSLREQFDVLEQADEMFREDVRQDLKKGKEENDKQFESFKEELSLKQEEEILNLKEQILEIDKKIVELDKKLNSGISEERIRDVIDRVTRLESQEGSIIESIKKITDQTRFFSDELQKIALLRKDYRECKDGNREEIININSKIKALSDKVDNYKQFLDQIDSFVKKQPRSPEKSELQRLRELLTPEDEQSPSQPLFQGTTQPLFQVTR